jgi:hydrogenase maturation protease
VLPGWSILMKKILVLGLGNPILRDDSIGLRIVQQVHPLFEDDDNVVVSEDYWGGLRLMERLVGYDAGVIVDAIISGEPPGTMRLLHPDSMPTQRSASAHDVNLPTALAFGRKADASLPDNDNIHIIAIEVVDVLNFGETLTPAVEAAIPQAVEAVLDAVRQERESE